MTTLHGELERYQDALKEMDRCVGRLSVLGWFPLALRIRWEQLIDDEAARANLCLSDHVTFSIVNPVPSSLRTPEEHEAVRSLKAARP